MTPEPLTCPYCNAQVPPPGPEEARSRILCPRCGETFAHHPADTAVAAGPPPTSRGGLGAEGARAGPRLLEATPAHVAVQLAVISGLVVAASLALRLALPESSTTRTAFPFMFLLGAVGAVAAGWLWYFRARRDNAATALFLLGNMGMVALVVLAYALATTEYRRSHDPPPKSGLNRTGLGKDGKPGKGQEPGKLAALGYLPEDSNLLVGIHVADLWRDEAGKAFLKKPSWEPLKLVLEQVKEWTGLKKDKIDHIAFGAKTDLLSLRFTAVVRTTRPYDPKSFRVFLEGKSKPMVHEGRLLYPLQVPLGPLLKTHGALWCVGDRTLVLTIRDPFSSFEKLKKSLPLKPRRGSEGLRPALRTCLEKRLPRGTWAWVAGESVRAEMLAAVLPLGRKGKVLPEPLRAVNVFSAGLRFAAGAEEVILSGDLQCSTEEAAMAVQSLLEDSQLPGLESLMVVGPASPAREQALRGATAFGLGASAGAAWEVAAVAQLATIPPAEPGPEARRWVHFQVQAPLGRLREALRGGPWFFPGPGKGKGL
jgi:hypothetical protein